MNRFEKLKAGFDEGGKTWSEIVCAEIDELDKDINERVSAHHDSFIQLLKAHSARAKANELRIDSLEASQNPVPATLESTTGNEEAMSNAVLALANARLVRAQARALEIKNERNEQIRARLNPETVNTTAPAPDPFGLEEKLVLLGNHQVELWRETDGWLICFQAPEGKRTFGGVSVKAIVDRAFESLDAK
jgi:hypothetical protein